MPVYPSLRLHKDCLLYAFPVTPYYFYSLTPNKKHQWKKFVEQRL